MQVNWRIRLCLGAAACIIIILGASCASAPSTTAWSRVSDEHLIYAAALDSIFYSAPASSVVIYRMTRKSTSGSWPAPVTILTPADAATLDFDLMNASPRRLTNIPTTRTHVIIADHPFADMPYHHGEMMPRSATDSTLVNPLWEAFREKFQGASTVVALTRPGFSVARDSALMQMTYVCGIRCAGMYVLLLQRNDGTWTLVDLRHATFW